MRESKGFFSGRGVVGREPGMAQAVRELLGGRTRSHPPFLLPGGEETEEERENKERDLANGDTA
jgi:hypothetical protein